MERKITAFCFPESVISGIIAACITMWFIYKQEDHVTIGQLLLATLAAIFAGAPYAVLVAILCIYNTGFFNIKLFCRKR